MIPSLSDLLSRRTGAAEIINRIEHGYNIPRPSRCVYEHFELLSRRLTPKRRSPLGSPSRFSDFRHQVSPGNRVSADQSDAAPAAPVELNRSFLLHNYLLTLLF